MRTSMKKLRGSQWNQPMQTVVQNHQVSYPTPSNQNSNYNWGVQAGQCLVLQIQTGIFLAMHYTAHVDLAFHSVQHLMRDVPNGWLLRYLHANGRSLFFIVVYMHLFRGLYYTSYAQPREFVWLVGVVILQIMIQTAFIGYVQPWGQMSLWGRTVITSLASALPVVGTSIVGWQWGGFCVLFFAPFSSKLKENENLAYCGESFLLSHDTCIDAVSMESFPALERVINSYNLLEHIEFMKNFLYVQYMIRIVKKLFIYSQSAGVCFVATFCIPRTFFVSTTKTAPQRLNAREQAWLVGIYEADGWFGTNKNGKYVQYEFGIEQHKKDRPLLHQLKNKQKVSRNVRVQKSRDTVVQKVRKKSDLINKIVPIFDNFPVIGAKKYQYDFFREHLITKSTVYSIDVHTEIRRQYKNCEKYSTVTNHETLRNSMNRLYLDAWQIGFMNGEGCFSIYQATKEKNKTCSFSIGQKVDGYFLLIIVKHILKLEKNTVFFDKKTNCYTLKTTSVKGVSSVLKFIHKAPVKLVGSKRIEYFQWAKSIRTNTRYNTVKVPKNLSAIATAHDIVRSFQ